MDLTGHSPLVRVQRRRVASRLVTSADPSHRFGVDPQVIKPDATSSRSRNLQRWAKPLRALQNPTAGRIPGDHYLTGKVG